MADDLFYTFKAPLFSDPLAHLKQMLVNTQEELKEEELRRVPSRNIKERLEISIRNLKAFIDFVEKEVKSGSISCLEKTTRMPQGFGTDSVLLVASDFASKNIEGDLKERMIRAVYPDGDKRSRKAYFKKMRVPQIYAWWEKGEITREPFGRVAHDTFRGFLKVG